MPLQVETKRVPAGGGSTVLSNVTYTLGNTVAAGVYFPSITNATAIGYELNGTAISNEKVLYGYDIFGNAGTVTFEHYDPLAPATLRHRNSASAASRFSRARSTTTRAGSVSGAVRISTARRNT